MTDIQRDAIAAISAAQNKVTARSAPWMVGEQLKDICSHEPASAELILRDITGEGMGLADAERKIKEHADAHRVGRFACVTPAEADQILRTFYGLPPAGAAAEAKEDDAGIIDLLDFLG